LNYKLYYISYLTILEGYIDTNWIFDTNDLKFTSRYIFTFGIAVMSLKSFKQMCNIRSMMESKFITLDKVEEEVGWIQNLVKDIPYWLKPMQVIYIHYNNQTIIETT